MQQFKIIKLSPQKITEKTYLLFQCVIYKSTSNPRESDVDTSTYVYRHVNNYCLTEVSHLLGRPII